MRPMIQFVAGADNRGGPEHLSRSEKAQLTALVSSTSPRNRHGQDLFESGSDSTFAIEPNSSCTNTVSSRIAQSASPTAPTQKKRVMFRLEEDGSVACQYIESEEVLLKEEEVFALWWTADERLSFLMECLEEIETAKENPDIKEAFGFLYKSCRLCGLFDQQDSSSSLNHGPESKDMQLFRLERTNPTLEKCIKIVSSTPFRGLEVKVFGPFYRNRKRVVGKILHVQNSLPLHDRAEVLASKSRSLTRRSQHLARVMAEADHRQYYWKPFNVAGEVEHSHIRQYEETCASYKQVVG